MSGVVVDSSVALKWAVTEPDSAIAQSLLKVWISTGLDLLAPDLFAYEVANVLYRRALLGEFTMLEARTMATTLLSSSGMQLIPISGPALSLRAMELAEHFHLKATYDPHYLALAEREGCEFWTADEKLVNAVKADLPWVHALGEHAAAP